MKIGLIFPVIKPICESWSSRLSVEWYKMVFTIMGRKKLSKEDVKVESLRRHRALHPHPEVVRDEAFQCEEFLDPRDRVQVKYEMLRRHRVEGKTVSDVSATFGVSRQAFYLAEEAFEREGVSGLLPKPKGPRRAHKCSDEVLDFVERWRQDPTDRPLSEAIQERFGVSIHPRSIDRALARRQKKLKGKERQP